MKNTYIDILNFVKSHDWGYDAVVTAHGVKVGMDWVNTRKGTKGREFSIVSTIREAKEWGEY